MVPGEGIDLAAPDHVSSRLWPFGERFKTLSGTWARIFGLSALTLGPDLSTLYALCDRGALFSATIRFNASSLQLVEVAWQQRWALESSDGHRVDSEGLTLLRGANNRMLISSEPAAVYDVPRPDSRSGGHEELQVRPLRMRLPRGLVNSIGKNRGLEALTSFSVAQDAHIFVTGVEGWSDHDSPIVRRLMEVDTLTGNVTKEVVLPLEANEPTLYLTELAALDSLGLSGGGQFLALVRGYSHSSGNDIRLYLVDTAGADDVSSCVAIGTPDDGEARIIEASAVRSSCRLGSLVAARKKLLLQWTRDLPLAGHLTVDNYEGMVIVPPEAFNRTAVDVGGVMVLLINDNNNSPKQIGTQLVSMRLPFLGVGERGPEVDAIVQLRGSPLGGSGAWVGSRYFPDQLTFPSVVLALLCSMLLLGLAALQRRRDTAIRMPSLAVEPGHQTACRPLLASEE